MICLIFYKKFLTILFADDTTLTQNSDDFHDLMNKFNTSLDDLIQWCHFNKVDINWDKSEIIFYISYLVNFISIKNLMMDKHQRTFLDVFFIL